MCLVNVLHYDGHTLLFTVIQPHANQAEFNEFCFCFEIIVWCPSLRISTGNSRRRDEKFMKEAASHAVFRCDDVKNNVV